MTLHFPLKPHAVEIIGEQLQATGLQPSGRVDDNLQLMRRRVQQAVKGDATTAMSPFFQVTRTLQLGLEWRVSTEVTRLSPLGTPMLLDVPLIPGEEVLTPSIHSDHGHVTLSLSPQTTMASWDSRMAPASGLKLVASPDLALVETWVLDVSPLWHWRAERTRPLKPTNEAVRTPVYRPWPSEQLALTVSQPPAVAGASFTIVKSSLRLMPGLRFRELALSITVRASRGLQHEIVLPGGFTILKTAVNGMPRPLIYKDGLLQLPIDPGESTFTIEGREDVALAAQLMAPTIDLKAPSVNAEVVFTLPSSRWLLWTAGPTIGPVVLYWSQVFVVLLVALILARIPLTPLRTLSWFMLALGLTHATRFGFIVPCFTLLAFGWRAKQVQGSRWSFNFIQVGLVLLALLSVHDLYDSMMHGLLGTPHMQISGNGSSEAELHWYVDRVAAVLPKPWISTLPLLAYRGLMLVWSLWLAAALVRWVPWLWRAFTFDGIWRARPPAVAPEQPLAIEPREEL